MTVSMPYRSIQRVYFDDLDALNILHNVRYVLFMERARGELFNRLGFHWHDDVSKNPDKFSVIAEHKVSYLAPVRGEGDIAIDLEVSHLGKTSLIFFATVRGLGPDAPSFATGETRIVRLDPVSYRPCPWSDQFREAMRPLVRPA
jgi:acyl-CoA thioester hydrolase